MAFPFELPFETVQAGLDSCVDEVVGALESDFLTMAKGKGFIEYPAFEQGYETLKRATGNFRDVHPDAIFEAVAATPVAWIVLRAMLGFTPPEWAYAATRMSGTEVPQGAARTLDRTIRLNPARPLRVNGGVTRARLLAMVESACALLQQGVPEDVPGVLHRLDKADTRHGLDSLRSISGMGAPYAMLLYERFLGRPFASHRDSVSELVGDALEGSIESVLSSAGISFRKTKRAERLPGFDQAPDFIIPSEFNPQVVIEAKVTEDDGTARDKITRVQHLAALSRQGRGPDEPPRFEVIACIAGRGFKVRREDMKKLILATRGKVFTPRNMSHLVECTLLREFRSAAAR